MSSSEDEINTSPNELENLVTQIEDWTLDSDKNFINLKMTDVKPEIRPEKPTWNPSISDIPSTSTNPPRTDTRKESFQRSVRGYAGLSQLFASPDKYTPFDKMKGEPINPFGIYLDIDCIIGIEEAIDKWETALRIAIMVNKLDQSSIRAFVEKSLLNNVLRYWQNLTPEVLNTIFATDDNIANTITRVVEVLKLEFCGEGNFFKDTNTVNKYATALLRLQLCDICEIEKYVCVFQDYYYHIYNQVDNTTGYLSMFFAKIPDPWGQKLIDTYKPGETDTLGRRISHCRDKLSEWCADAILAKMSKGLKKRITLCCDKPKMPLMIGCDSPYYYGKMKKKFKKRKMFKNRYFKRRKVKYYKKKKYIPKKPTFARKKIKKNVQECRCYYCKEVGHYANKCPKKFSKNKKRFEIDEDISEMINQGEFIQINNFETLESDDSIFILTETEYSSSETEENE